VELSEEGQRGWQRLRAVRAVAHGDVGITTVLDGRLAPTVVTAPRIRVRVQVFGILGRW
jgi:hypothetical protein